MPAYQTHAVNRDDREGDFLMKRLEQLDARVNRIAPILEFIQDCTNCYEFASPWEFLEADPDCRSGSSTRSASCNSLRRNSPANV